MSQFDANPLIGRPGMMVSSFAVTFLGLFNHNFVVRQIYVIFYFSDCEYYNWLISDEFFDNTCT